MKSMTELDGLTGKEVTQAFTLHDLEQGWLQQVVFQVEDTYLVVKVDADTDEVILDLLAAMDLQALDKQFSRTQLSNQRKQIGRAHV